MDYVYGVYFSDDTVKYGRSVDLWKRLYNYDAEAKRFGKCIKSVLFSPVSDGVKSERALLAEASDVLKLKTKESFHAENLEQVASVFEGARIPYILAGMLEEKFGIFLSKDSFSPDYRLISGGVCGGSHGEGIRAHRIKKRILTIVDNYSGSVTEAIFKNKIMNYPWADVKAMIDAMVEDGTLVFKPSKSGRVMEYQRG